MKFVPCWTVVGQIDPIVVYYETITRNLKKRFMCECRCDTRLKAKAEGSTRLSYTVPSGTVIPKNIDEVNKRAVCECDG